MVPELRKDGDRHASLRYAARQEIALETFLESVGAKAFTTNFEDLGDLRQLPGIAVQRLMSKGYGFGAEGDWKTAVLVRAAKVMGEGLPGGASLMEDYTYDLTPGSEKILGAHMLEICPSLTTSRPRVEIHPLGIGGKEDPVRMVFDADPGVGVVVSLADMRDRFRLTANVVDVVAPSAPLPHLPVARAVWEPRPDFATSAEAWLTAGGAHHTVLSTAAGIDAFEVFADIARTELPGHRRGHDAPRLPRPGAVEPGVLPRRAGPLNPSRSDAEIATPGRDSDLRHRFARRRGRASLSRRRGGSRSVRS